MRGNLLAHKHYAFWARDVANRPGRNWRRDNIDARSDPRDANRIAGPSEHGYSLDSLGRPTQITNACSLAAESRR